MKKKARVIVVDMDRETVKTETELKEVLRENWEKFFPKNYDVDFEIPINGCVSGDIIGHADIMITRGKVSYLGEIKYHSTKAQSFWESLKIIGYCKSLDMFMFCTKKSKNPYIPFIMIPKEHMNYDFAVILYNLKCGYVTFDIMENRIELEINLVTEHETFI